MGPEPGLGRAVLQLATESGGFFKDLDEAEQRAARLRAAFRDTKKDVEDFGVYTIKASDAARVLGARSDESGTKVSALGAVARTAGGYLASAFTIGAIVKFLADTTAAGDRLVNLRERTGESVEALQAFERMADQGGTSLDAMTKNAEQLGIRLTNKEQGAVDAVKELGFSVDALLKMKPEDRFTSIMTALGGIPDAAQKSALGVALMGRGFTEVAGLATESFGEMRTQIEQSGTILSERHAEILAGINNRWGAFVADLKGSAGRAVATFVDAWTFPKEWFDRAIGVEDIRATIAGLERDARASAANAQAIAQALTPPKDGVDGYNALTASVAAAHREFRHLDEGQQQRARNMVLLGQSVQDVADALGISERAVQFLLQADKLKEEQDKRNTAETKKREEAERRLTEAYEKQVATIRDQLFGADAIRQAQQYLEAIGPIENVSRLNADAQARLAEIMRAGVEAMVLAGKGTEALSSQFEAMRLKATETGRDAAAAYQLLQSEAAVAAEAASAAERAMTENFVVIGGSAERTAEQVRGLRREVESTLQLLVPRGFSFEKAYQDAGFVVHNSLSGLRPFGEGGIVTGPTRALIGEKGPEAVIPLNRSGAVGGINVSVHVGTFVGSDRSAARQLARMVGDEVMRTSGRRFGPV